MRKLQRDTYELLKKCNVKRPWSKQKGGMLLAILVMHAAELSSDAARATGVVPGSKPQPREKRDDGRRAGHGAHMQTMGSNFSQT